MQFILAFGFLALIIQCGCHPIDTLSDFSWSEDSSLAAALLRVKKDADVIGYLEECALVDSWQVHPGSINVLAFLDASWEYSHRQATMLKMLQGRLERSGITGIKFFVINSATPEAVVTNVDVEDEKEAWGAADSAEGHSFSEVEKTREELRNKIEPDIAFFQDSDQLQIWEKLSASRDQVIVIDKCGRLSYKVIVPWSILHFPYVKAAILSTYKEQPCGACDLETTTVASYTEDAESQTEQLAELLTEDLNIKQMKEIVVKAYNLDQTDNTVKKVYHNTGSQEIPENVIKLLNGSATVKQEESNADFNNATKHRILMSTGYSNSNDSYVNRYSQAPNLTKDNNSDNRLENPVAIGDTLNINESAKTQNVNHSSMTIIYGSTDSVESSTVHSIKDESSDDRENWDYLDNNHKVDDNKFMESANPKNTSEEYEEKENLNTNLKNTSKDYEQGENSNTSSYFVESNKSGNDYISDNISDSEVSNTSVMSNHINKMILTSDETNAADLSENSDYIIPIRIIMHAPHIHEYEDPKKKYEYLVLKLGSPEYHGHLEYNNDFTSNENEANFESARGSGNGNEGITSKKNYEDEFGSGEFGINDNDKSGHKQSSSKHRGLVYDIDESPGFYGEDVEYWRNSGNADYQEKLQFGQPDEKIEHGKDNEKQTEGYDAVNITETNKNNSTINKATKNDTIIEESTSRYQTSETKVEYAKPSEEIVQGKESAVEQQIYTNNTEEEEIANQLFVHYSKLIPWLHYVIDE